jgi:hypothetical protein
MILQDKKKPASLIIEMMKKPNMTPKFMEAPTNEYGDEVTGDDAMEAAAKSFLNAVESKDTKSLIKNLQTLIELVQDAPKDEEAE